MRGLWVALMAAAFAPSVAMADAPAFLLRGGSVASSWLAPAGARVAVAASVTDTGRRFCPAGLGGACFDLRGNARLVGGPVVSNGAVSFSFPLPGNFPYDGVWMQAVVGQNGSASFGPVTLVPVYDATGDEDGDGLSNEDEVNFGTDLFNADSDSDLLLDGDEVWFWGTSPSNYDTDGGGTGDGFEGLYQGTNPLDPYDDSYNNDSDGDYISDTDEAWYGTDAFNWDTDYDTVGDYDELFYYGTNPTNPDTDGGGVSDGEELYWQSTDPFNPGDDIYNPDSDGDSILDNDEIWVYNTSPYSSDTDGDYLGDYEEIFGYGTDPNNPDTDGGGLWDADEIWAGKNPFDGSDDAY